VLTLRALQTSANNQGVESPVTWDAINQFGRQYGAPDIDYDRFAARWDSDPILQQLVARFDSQGVVVKTKKHSAQPGQTSDAASPSLVSQMAKHATSRALG
jgi:hypothetical protein